MIRNIGLLTTCQALFNTSTGVMLSVSALVGYVLAPEGYKWLATTPHGVQWLSTAAFAIPVSMLMRRVGRKAAFTLCSILGVLGALVAAGAIFRHEFWIFALATVIFGGFTAASQHYRFAAAEVASDSFRSRAISLVIGGGVVAAFLGPEIAKWTHDLAATWMQHDVFSGIMASVMGPEVLTPPVDTGQPPYEFAGTFLAMAFVPIVLIGIIGFIRFPAVPAPALSDVPRRLTHIMRQPGFIVAVLCSVIGWGVMVFMMAATPLAMTSQYHHHTTDAMFVVQWHMLGMFAPSFVTGSLIRRCGLLNVLLCGLALTTIAAVTGMFGGTLFHFWLANILVGAGWNFLFVGGTDLLTRCYSPSERAKAQGVNDFLVFGSVAAFSTAAGWVQDTAGWLTVCFVMIPFVAVVFVAVLWLKFTPGAAPAGVSDGRPARQVAPAE